MLEIPSLLYKYAELEPFIDERTMQIHHTKHQQAYVDKLNKAFETHPGLAEVPLLELLLKPESIPEEVRTVVLNNGKGYLNHSFFWKCLARPIKDGGGHPADLAIGTALEEQFGKFADFEEQFRDQAVGLFGSGWTWLVLNERRQLEIINTANHDLLPVGKIPLLVIDMWEHAYYLSYQNRKAEWFNAFLAIIDWPKANERYLEARAKFA